MPLPQPEPKFGGSPAGRGPRRPLRDAGRGGGPAALSARCPGLAATGGPVGRELRARGRRGSCARGVRPARPASPGGGRAAATASGTSPSGRPRGPAPSASPPCWTATHRVTHPPTQSAGSRPAGRQAGASRPGRRVAKGDTVAHASRPASLRGPPGCGRPCPAPARPLASSRHHAGPGRVSLMSVPWGPAAAPRVRVDARRRSPDALPSGPSAP